MHLAIDLDILHHSLAIGLQTTVKIMQVLNAADLTSRCVEEFRGKGLRNGIITFLLIARNKIVTFLLNHTI